MLPIVIGMHRSGTSITAGALHRLGVDMDDGKFIANEFNPGGYYERIWIVERHDALLKQLGSSWDALPPLPQGWWRERPAIQAREEIVAKLSAELPQGRRRLWGFKDPRLMRLLPLWLDVCVDLDLEPRIILATRDPDVVALSLARRDKMQREDALLLWSSYHLEFLHHVGSVPWMRVDHEEWMTDHRNLAARLVQFLDIPLDAHYEGIGLTLDDWVKPEWSHDNGGVRRSRSFAHWLYDQFAAQSFAPELGSMRLSDELTRTARDYHVFSKVFRPIIARAEALPAILGEKNHLLEEVKRQQGESAHRLDTLATQRTSLSEQLRAEKATVEDLQGRLKETERVRDGVAGHLQQERRTAEELRAKLAETEQERDGATGQLQEERRTAEELRTKLAEAVGARDSVVGRLQQESRITEELRAQLAEAERARSSVAAHLQDEQRLTTDLRARLTEAERVRNGVAGQLQEERRAGDELRARLADTERERNGVADQLQEERRVGDELRTRLSELGHVRDTVAAQLVEERAAADDLRTRLSDAESRHNSLTGQIQEERAAADDLRTRLSDAESRHNSLTGQIQEERAAADDLRTRLSDAESRQAGLMVQLEQALRNLDDQQARTLEIDQINARYLQQLAELSRQRDVMAADMQVKIAALETERQQVADQLFSLGVTRDELAARLVNAEQNAEGLRDRAEITLRRAHDEAERLQEEVDQRAERLAEAHRTIRQLSKGCDEAVQALDTVRAEHQKLLGQARHWARQALAGRQKQPDLARQAAHTAKVAALLMITDELFAPGHYLCYAHDLQEAGVDPWEHFRASGWREARFPTPLLHGFAPYIANLVDKPDTAYRLFDAGYYNRRYPDVAASGIDAFQHYCTAGWRENRSPNALFRPDSYFAANPDVVAAGVNPLSHYALVGWREGRDTGGIFDVNFYLRTYPDVAETGLDPLSHFVFHGLGEGRFPNRVVDPGSYLAKDELSLAPWDRVTLLVERMEGMAQQAAGTVVLAAPTTEPRLTVIVYASDIASSVLCCMMRLAALGERVPVEIIVLDLGSRDLLPFMAPCWPNVRYLRATISETWAQAMNRAAATARGEIIITMDGGVDPGTGWLEELTGTLEREPRTAVVGARILLASGRIRHAGGMIWADGDLAWRGVNADASHPMHQFRRAVDFVTPALAAVRADSFFGLGGFDDAYQQPEYAMADLCLRAGREQYGVVMQPLAQATDYAGMQIGNVEPDRQRLRMLHQDVMAQRQGQPERERLDFKGTVGHALIIDEITPTPDADAGSVVQWHLIKLLISMGWAVSFLPHADMRRVPRYTADLQRIGVNCVFAPHYQNLYEFLRDEGDTVTLAIPHRAPSAAHYLDVIRTFAPQAKILLNTCDIHYIREMRGAEVAQSAEAMAEAERTKKTELQAISQCDSTIVISLYEVEVISRELPDANLVVLPLIMDAPGLQVPFESLRDFCFIGGYKHKPNQDAVKYFVQEVWPLVKARLPDARFRIMGSHVPADIQALHGDGIIVDGFVPDLPGSLGRCRLSVAPLRYGAGIKGKVGSSLGLGIPCVASPVAAEGMGLGPNDGVEIAATPEEMADRICRLYTDDAHWHRMSAGGVAFVDREYSMRTVAKRLQQILTDLGLPIGG